MHKLCIIISLLTVMSGCATQPLQEDTNSYWWYARYQIAPDENGQTRWPVDLLIADRIVEPVLEQYRGNIKLWRFHRRSVDDSAGHQFSFIFYADKQTAADIFVALEKDPLMRVLLQEEILRRFLPDSLSDNYRTALRATSDENWSPSMQKHWPEYIMGVSELWLGLINEFIRGRTGNIERMLAEYGRVDREIKALWYTEGNHALFHHMHAIFGYPPPRNTD